MGIHNETVNIHSHLWAAIVFVAIPFVALYANRHSSFDDSFLSFNWLLSSPADLLPFLPFLIGAVACLTTSGLFHATSNVSPNVARIGNQLDYVGIVFLIMGSFISSLYFGFACSPYWRNFYWGMISVLGAGCTIVSVKSKFRTPLWRPFRAGMFVAMGLSAIFPVFHGVALYGIEEMERRIGGTQLVTQGLLYILGASLYAMRWPECKWPGSFDIWGASHQLFHILVVMAAYTHFWGLVRAADYAKNFDVCKI